MSDPQTIRTVRDAVKSMVQQGATEAEVDEYVKAWNVTPEQIRAAGFMAGEVVPTASDPEVADPTSPAWARRQIDKRVGEVQQAVSGPPGSRDLPAFESTVRDALPIGPTGEGIPGVAGAVTWDDEQYGNVIKNLLGDRLVGTERDKNGYEIITYRGDDGKEYVAYVNKPGLDLSDVNRELAAAVPRVLAGLALGSAARGMGLGWLGRVMTAGTGEAALETGTDMAARGVGADPKVWDSILRTATAGGGGMLFEGLSGPVTRAWQKIFGTGIYKVDPATGKLSEGAAEVARMAGLDPDDMDRRLAEQFARQMRTAADPVEVGTSLRTQEFGIPTTQGQRTKRPDLLTTEEEMRRNQFGETARKTMEDLDQRQSDAVQRAVDDSIGMSLAPNQAGREAATTGSGVLRGVQKSKRQWDLMEDDLWGELGPMYPDPAGRAETLSPILNERLGTTLLDEASTPNAHRMMTLLENYTEGRPTRPPYKLLTQESELSADDIRRQLKGMMDDAAPGSYDKGAAAKIYGAYNDWIDELADRAAMTGDAEMASKLRVARAFSKELHGLFEPKAAGVPTTAAKKIGKLINPETTPEEALDTLLGRGAPTGSPPEGVVPTLRQVQRVLGDAGRGAWDDIRLAYWVKLTQGKQKNGGWGVLSPIKLRGNINSALTNQKSVLDVLYSPEEQATMQRLAAALEDVTYTPPNPSGTSYALTQMNKRGRVTQDMLGRASWRAWLQGDWIQSVMLRMLARNAPEVMGMREYPSRVLGRRLTSQEIQRRPGSPLVMPLGAEATTDWLGGQEETRP